MSKEIDKLWRLINQYEEENLLLNIANKNNLHEISFLKSKLSKSLSYDTGKRIKRLQEQIKKLKEKNKNLKAFISQNCAITNKTLEILNK